MKPITTYIFSWWWFCVFWPNSPAPLTDDWKVTDNSSINFHDVFFFIFAIIWQKMKKNTSWKFTDESSVTFQSSVSAAGEFSLSVDIFCQCHPTI